MKNMKRLLVFLIALGAISAKAQVPSGQFTYVFTNEPLWDVTGTYALNGSSNGVTDNATFVITNAAKGTITGTQAEIINDGIVTVNVHSTVTGKISVKAGEAVASLKSSGTFSGSLTGTAKGKSTETIVESNLTILATVSETLSAHGGSRKFTATTSASLPGGMDGDWQLDTSITNVVNRLSGTGTLTLSNGREFDYAITGTYKPTTGVAKLKLAGAGAALGTSFRLTTEGTNMDLTALNGKILGQKPTF